MTKKKPQTKRAGREAVLDKQLTALYQSALVRMTDECQSVLHRLKNEARAMGTELSTNAERMTAFTNTLQGYAKQAGIINEQHRKLEARVDSLAHEEAEHYDTLDARLHSHRRRMDAITTRMLDNMREVNDLHHIAAQRLDNHTIVFVMGIVVVATHLLLNLFGVL